MGGLRFGYLLPGSTAGESRVLVTSFRQPVLRYFRSMLSAGFMGVIAGHPLICQPLAMSFWTKPVSLFGLFTITTVHPHVRFR